MGFYEDLLVNYGEETQRTFKEWNRLVKKLTNMSSRRIFLLQCRKHCVFPKHIINQSKSLDSLYEHRNPFNKDISKIHQSFRRKVQNIEIKITNWKIDDINNRISHIKSTLQNLVPIDIVEEFENSQKTIRNKWFCKKRETLSKKFCCLVNNDKSNNENNMFFVNRTNKVIPDVVKEILSYGDKFALNHNKSDFPLDDLISDLEIGLEQIKNESDRNIMRTQCVNQITNYVVNLDNRRIRNRVDVLQDQMFKTAKQFLNNNKDIIITKADKGNITVALDKNMYDIKINELLLDEHTYKRNARDPTSTLQTKCNNFIRDLLEGNYIDITTSNHLRTHNAVAPRLYGLPKIHKGFSIADGDPLRPIVSCINSPCYNLSKYFNNILNKITDQHKYDLLSSIDLKKSLDEITLDDSDMLVSFDVQALFTNIPTDNILELIRDRWSEIKIHTKIPMGLFLEILKFILDSGYFVHNGIIYKQVFGTPMGGPISPVLAKILMDDVISKSLKKIDGVKLIKVYIDDLLIILPQDKLDFTLDVFNSYHDRIKFTVEKEMDNKLPFLDLMIHRKPDGKLITNWYQKPCASGRMISFFSNQPYHQKINCAKNFINKVHAVSDEAFYDSNKDKIINILKLNQFPNGLIKNLINKFTPNKKLDNTNNRTQEKNKVKYLKLPYIKNLSENINRILREKIPVQCAYYNIKKVGNLYTKLKYPIPKELKSNFIYKTNCSDCKATYIGCSTQYFKARMYQHKHSIKTKKKNTALAIHATNEKHEIEVDNSIIVRSDKDERKLKWLEMLYIKKSKDNINHRTDIAGCLSLYDNVYRKIYN